jgi:sugar phosphate isomerase/epimerase
MALARRSGVSLALEHNSISTRHLGFVHTLRDGIALSEATGLGVCLEIQNCWFERELPEMIRDHVGKFVVVQVSDYLTGESVQLNRRVFGDGSIPLEWLLGLLLDAGFAGYFEIETLGPAIEAEGYESSIRRNIEWLNDRLVKWGV